MLSRAGIIRQFKQPSGFVGWLAGTVMALRPSNRRRNAWTIKLLDIRPDDRVFELGCGPGLALARAAKKARRGEVIGVDHSEAMVHMARRRLRRAIKAGNASVVVGDDRTLESYIETLDALYSVNVVQFLADRDRYFQQSFAALRPGGRIATTYQPRGAAPTASKADVMAHACSDSMARAGFQNIRTEVLLLKPVHAFCVLGAKLSKTD